MMTAVNQEAAWLVSERTSRTSRKSHRTNKSCAERRYLVEKSDEPPPSRKHDVCCRSQPAGFAAARVGQPCLVSRGTPPAGCSRLYRCGCSYSSSPRRSCDWPRPQTTYFRRNSAIDHDAGRVPQSQHSFLDGPGAAAGAGSECRGRLD
jgi:hypothetical protein